MLTTYSYEIEIKGKTFKGLVTVSALANRSEVKQAAYFNNGIHFATLSVTKFKKV